MAPKGWKRIRSVKDIDRELFEYRTPAGRTAVLCHGCGAEPCESCGACDCSARDHRCADCS